MPNRCGRGPPRLRDVFRTDAARWPHRACGLTRLRRPRASPGSRQGCRGAATLSGVRAIERKFGPEACPSAKAPIRHWLPIHLRCYVILDRPSDHPSRGRIVRTPAGGPVFHASEAGAAALRTRRRALRTRVPTHTRANQIRRKLESVDRNAALSQPSPAAIPSTRPTL